MNTDYPFNVSTRKYSINTSNQFRNEFDNKITKCQTITKIGYKYNSVFYQDVTCHMMVLFMLVFVRHRNVRRDATDRFDTHFKLFNA